MGGAIDYPESPLGVPCGGEVKLNKLAVFNTQPFKAIAIGFSLGASRSIEKFVIPAHQQRGPQRRPQSADISGRQRTFCSHFLQDDPVAY